MIEISPLQAEDRVRWEELARGYKEFYRTEVSEDEYERTWQRLLQAEDVFGCAARLDGGRVVGIAHYLFHTNPWSSRSCYLQDLFVDVAARGHGTGRLLIEHVAQAARDHGAARLYWHTKQDNQRARLLYDKVADFREFIRYDYPLD
ncbi:GNAT family N-acetyltransferase [Amycolatopsis carbonis]|uniref:GNAT family N-acetyltransferase n=1 Tax=Amycolatopsis carbonis TaxID=715471 RepID=A0A9Y2IP42_9PSEU|nr:GNAT family N-acetyltransferase [Amycolatopsis sp. 2-15]WIX83692.1 GNAT family N-acetyltransferase [Amycolatopsis sp. 2-15]